MQVTNKVQNELGKFAAINVISHAELYGGKICAALDRQHPRDLFDVKLLLENEGYSDDVRYGVLVSLLSHYKPIHELIYPIFKDQKSAFERQFEGMASIDFSYGDYMDTREKIVNMVNHFFTGQDKELLYSFEDGNPKWENFAFGVVKKLPAVQWKLQNINRLKKENPLKHKRIMLALEKLL